MCTNMRSPPLEKANTSPDDAFEEEMRNDEVIRLYRRLANEDTPEALDQRMLESYWRIVPTPAPLPIRLFRRLLSYWRSRPFMDVLKRQWRRLVSR
jgi:hypothetical protein